MRNIPGGTGTFEEIAARVGSSIPPELVFVGGAIEHGQQPLFPEEEAAVRRAVPKRRAEFRAGRTFSRAALLRLGHPAAAIPVGPDRVPDWPPGVVASITHDDVYCAVMAARTTDVAAIGLDLEPADPLPADIVRLVCSEAELRDRTAREAELELDLPKLVFCAKESAYKAYFWLARSMLEFGDVEVHVNPRDAAFRARFAASAAQPYGLDRTIDGRFVKTRTHIVAWAAVWRDSASRYGFR